MEKKLYLIIIIIILCISNLASCKEPYGIEFESTILDFGTTDEGINVDLIYKFKNTGLETLVILDVRPSCGCTAADDWDKSVESGKTGQIPITFRTSGYQGEVTKTINIQTNVPGQENITLTLKGIVTSPVAINPSNNWLGEVTVEDKPLNGSFEIKNNQDIPLLIEEIIPPDEKTTFKLVIIEAEKQYRLDFTVNPPFEGREVTRKTISLKTGGEMGKYYQLTYSYFVPPPVQVYPMKVLVNKDLIVNSKMERRVNIKGNIDKAISVQDLQFNMPGVESSVKEVRAGGFYQIVLTFPQEYTFPENEKIFYLTFKVENDPGNSLYTVSVEEYTQ